MLLVFACGNSETTDITDYPACDEYGEPLFIGKLIDKRLSEISGMAFSRKNKNVFYLHNDAGHSSVIYAINTKREVLGTLVLENLNTEDWEDMSLAKCGNEDCIFVADTGDNKEKRNEVSVIRFVEPVIDSDIPFGSILIDSIDTMTLKYLDKPHDVEALVVSDEEIYLFSKQAGYSAYFKVSGFDPKQTKTLSYVGRINLLADELVTAADVHSDGLQLLLRTNDNIYEYTFDDKSQINSLADLTYSKIKAGDDEQGEAIAYNPATGSIWHTSEAVADDNPAIYEIRCK